MHNTNRKLLIAAVVLAILGIALSILARWYPLFSFDIRLAQLIQSTANDPLTFIMRWISLLFGDLYATFLVIAAGLLLWWRLGRAEGIMMPVAGLVSLINSGLKLLIGRARPTSEQLKILVNEVNNGFPSSHSFFSMIFLGMLAYLLYTHLKNKPARILSLVLLILLILIIGFSRIYLGAHWPSDVLGGYIIGGFFLTLLIWGYNSWGNKHKT